jgi:hypothetical protein
VRRREFMTLLSGAAAAWPVTGYGQQPAKLPTIGFVGDSPDGPWAALLRAFRLGLKATGFTEGQNVTVEYRWAAGQNDKLPALNSRTKPQRFRNAKRAPVASFYGARQSAGAQRFATWDTLLAKLSPQPVAVRDVPLLHVL